MESAAVILIVTILQVTGVVALALWEKLMVWVVESLFVWIKDTLPKLAKFSGDVVKLAFTVVTITSTISIQAIREAWKTIRPFLFGMIMNFEKEASSWIRVIRSKLLKLDASDKPVIVTRESREQIAFEDLPSDVREAVIRGSKENREINIKEIRDRELLEMSN
jgi:hypothetical protein